MGKDTTTDEILEDIKKDSYWGPLYQKIKEQVKKERQEIPTEQCRRCYDILL